MNVSIIANKLVEVPMIKPIKPNSPISVFFAIIAAFAEPFLFFMNTHVSISAGNASPSDDRHKAPNNEINKSNLGIATANKTVNKGAVAN